MHTRDIASLKIKKFAGMVRSAYAAAQAVVLFQFNPFTFAPLANEK